MGFSQQEEPIRCSIVTHYAETYCSQAIKISPCETKNSPEELLMLRSVIPKLLPGLGIGDEAINRL